MLKRAKIYESVSLVHDTLDEQVAMILPIRRVRDVSVFVGGCDYDLLETFVTRASDAPHLNAAAVGRDGFGGFRRSVFFLLFQRINIFG